MRYYLIPLYSLPMGFHPSRFQNKMHYGYKVHEEGCVYLSRAKNGKYVSKEDFEKIRVELLGAAPRPSRLSYTLRGCKHCKPII